MAFLSEIARPECEVRAVLEQAMEIPPDKVRDRAHIARRVLARRLYEGLTAGGLSEVAERARNHRVRIVLWRTNRVC